MMTENLNRQLIGLPFAAAPLQTRLKKERNEN